MKKILILLVIVAGAHYAAWNYVAGQAEANFHKLVEEKMRYKMGGFDYKITKSGYPSKIILEMLEMQISAPNMEVILNSDSGDGISISVPFSLAADTFLIDFSDSNYTFILKSPDEDIAMDMSVGESKSTVTNNGNSYNITGFTDDLNIGIETGDQGKVNIDIASVDINETVNTSNGEIDSHTEMKMTDAKVVLRDGDEDVSFGIDSYVMSGGIKKFPDTLADFKEIVLPLVEKLMEGNQGATLETAEIKAYLKDLVEKMAEHRSVIYIDELSYALSDVPEVGSFGFSLNSKLKVADDYTLRGDVGININGLNKVAEMIMKKEQSGNGMMNMPPMALAFMQSGSIELSLKTDEKGMVIFNGMPVLQSPPLNNIIDTIPNIISKDAM